MDEGFSRRRITGRVLEGGRRSGEREGKGKAVRILIVSVLLGLTAACAPPPPEAAPGATPSASAIAAVLAPPGGAAPVALVPAPAGSIPAGPVAIASAPPPGAPVVVPLPPWVPFGWLWGPEPGGRLTLSNFSYDTARVQAVLTNGPECTIADPAAAADFVMPLNATRIIPTPAGVDVCWRREVPATASSQAARGPAMPGWADWNRSYTGSGRFIDARL